jgi:hypothetical protein
MPKTAEPQEWTPQTAEPQEWMPPKTAEPHKWMLKWQKTWVPQAALERDMEEKYVPRNERYNMRQ